MLLLLVVLILILPLVLTLILILLLLLLVLLLLVVVMGMGMRVVRVVSPGHIVAAQPRAVHRHRRRHPRVPQRVALWPSSAIGGDAAVRQVSRAAAQHRLRHSAALLLLLLLIEPAVAAVVVMLVVLLLLLLLLEIMHPEEGIRWRRAWERMLSGMHGTILAAATSAAVLVVCLCTQGSGGMRALAR